VFVLLLYYSSLLLLRSFELIEYGIDTELLKLIGFLRCLHNTPDVRPIIRDHFKSYKLIEEAGALNSNYRY
jgi:hypothetical protein